MKKIINLMLGVICIISCIFIVKDKQIIDEYNNNQEIIEMYKNMDEGAIQLTDTYDTDSSSFEDFLYSKTAYDILNNTYETLKNCNFKYYEITNQPLYYIGKYTKSDNANHEYINETIKNELYTECDAWSISESFYNDYNIGTKVLDGTGFDNISEVNIHQTIPIILGYDYYSHYKLGEVFTGKFILDKKMQFIVVGFLKQNASINLSQKIVLDGSILLPSISLNGLHDNIDKLILLSIKVEGYVFYEDSKEYQLIAEKIDRIHNSTEFEYRHISTPKDYMGISYKQNINSVKRVTICKFIVMSDIIVIISLNLIFFVRNRKRC